MTSKRNPGRRTERRRGPRFTPARFVAYYWTGGIPTPHPVREISAYGASIIATDVFYPGTTIWLSLHDMSDENSDRKACGGVWGQVIRNTKEGFCVEFAFESRADRLAFGDFMKEVRQRCVHETNGKKP